MGAVEASILVAGLALVGTLIGHLVTHRENIRANERHAALIAYRLEQLELKVEAHNNLIERTYCLEKKVGVVENKIENNSGRIKSLEGKI